MNPQLVAINLELGISTELLATRQLSECQEASCLEVAEVDQNSWVLLEFYHTLLPDDYL